MKSKMKIKNKEANEFKELRKTWFNILKTKQLLIVRKKDLQLYESKLLNTNESIPEESILNDQIDQNLKEMSGSATQSNDLSQIIEEAPQEPIYFALKILFVLISLFLLFILISS